MDAFTWITGVTSLLSFGIQIFDLFPKFRETRKGLLIFSSGLFFGNLMNAIEPSSIKIQLHLTGFNLLVIAFTLGLLALLVTAIFTPDQYKRTELFYVCGAGLIPYIFILFFGSLISGTVTNPKVEQQKITSSELFVLSDRSIELKDYERSIMHLKTIQSRLDSRDERTKEIDKKINEIMQLEIQPSSK